MSTAQVARPAAGGCIESHRPTGTPVPLARRRAADVPRVAYAAAHVVADPLAEVDPWLVPAIDWEATLRFRRRLWDLGLGVAEAMDTAQRGMGLGWPEARQLIGRALREAAAHEDTLIACGAGTDHLAPEPEVTIDSVIAACEEQFGAIESLGGRIILMASRAPAPACENQHRMSDRVLTAAPCRARSRRHDRPGSCRSCPNAVTEPMTEPVLAINLATTRVGRKPRSRPRSSHATEPSAPSRRALGSAATDTIPIARSAPPAGSLDPASLQ